ncbi:MAG: hypothetical protein LBJ67_11500 [Planctomycetaceae bacterium]|nr:hypothetical protein [Planctomycetaceae bacterium]
MLLLGFFIVSHDAKNVEVFHWLFANIRDFMRDQRTAYNKAYSINDSDDLSRFDEIDARRSDAR